MTTRTIMPAEHDANVVDRCLKDAFEKRGVRKGLASWRAWPQTWGSTTIGFPGIGGAAMTTAQTVVVTDDLTGEHHVYFGGRYAYTVQYPSEQFWESVRAENLPGVYADRGGLSR